MTALPQRYYEDKALRDQAKAVFDADLAHFKESIADEGIGGRLKSQITGKVKRRVSAGAHDILEQAKEQASDHRSVLAILLGAVILWFAREPVLGWLGLGDDAENDADDQYDENDAEDFAPEHENAAMRQGMQDEY
jgi:hypothetical protein